MRAAWDWLWRTAIRYAPEGTFRWHLLTWLGHATLTAVCVGVAALLSLVPGVADLRLYGLCIGAGYYTIREAEQLLLSRASAPWWDSVGDVLTPWLLGWWLAT